MYDWKNVILRPSDTLEDAIKTLDREALKIVMISDENDRLVGTITDGDIRRALIRHLGMDSQLKSIMFKSPTTASVTDDRKAILSMMKSKNLLQVPIIDANKKIVGLETLQHLLEKNKIDNPVFLMAGGFGKRLRPLTDNTPKPMLNVGSKPILEIILEQFINSGFHDFYISTHYKSEIVREHFGNGDKWGINIQYIHEDQPLGTAGALGLLPKNLPDLPILMMNGDLLTKINFEQLLNFHNEYDGVATICVREYDFQVPFGVVSSNGHVVTNIVEKPVHKFFVNAGIYVLSPSLVDSVDGFSFLDMPNLLEKKINEGGQVNTFPIHEYWLDIGRIEEYEQASEAFNNIFGED